MTDGYSGATSAQASGIEVWRRGLASAGALLLALLFGALVYLTAESNEDRDSAAQRERQSFEIITLARGIEGSIARSEAALGRFVINSDGNLGTIYRNEWRAAGRQIDQLDRMVRYDAAQSELVDGLQTLYETYGAEISPAARYATSGRNLEALSLHNSASGSATGAALIRRLETIANAERTLLGRRSAARVAAGERAALLGTLMTIAGIILGLAAIILAYATIRAFRERHQADQRVDDLEDAVAARTAELEAVNTQLRAEAIEREAAEQQLRQVQKLEAVGQLTGGIAHDFNNMLAVVIGGLDLAKRKIGRNPAEADSHIDNALEGANRAAALTRRLLAFARAEPFLPEGTDAAARIDSMVDLIRRSIGEQITVSIDAEPGTWPVWIDPHQLENSVLNLAVNARDAMEGRGELTFAIRNATLEAGDVGEVAPGEYLQIAVTDNGCGMSEDIIEHVFEPFFTTKPVGRGTGLGLSQIFGFAQQSGGGVGIDSTVGRGTTVSLYLPRFEGDIDTKPRGMAQSGQTHGQSMKSATILVVEDDQRVRRATVAGLEELGHRVVSCANGQTALDILSERADIDLLLTDVVMPEMTGPELAAQVSERHPGLPIIFVTGYAREAADTAQFAGHVVLRKPFTITALSETIDAVYGNTRSEAAE
ncbi:response regulator [Parasphingopyxis marina]|uniref:histidine kinase n=1 Tax=Parasphingopyxis marina TaxID=2761622 RepID=A0A842HVL2_9SPHN|nr:response regulator [Parasphingopyxis marina]MBC2777002.1 response regulator [Parasphingopyxis marina]